MRSKIIVFYARSWSMTDENTGENRSGVSIQYTMSDSLAPISSDTDKGVAITKESITPECAAALKDVPGLYEAEFEFKAQGGKNVLHVCGLTFISPLTK